METGYVRLDVYFEDPFWVCLCRRGSGIAWEASKIVFGAEPKDCQVYDFLLANYHRLEFSPSMEGRELSEPKASNPKREKRRIKRRLAAMGTGTKAQQALRLQREQGKADRRQAAHSPTVEPVVTTPSTRTTRFPARSSPGRAR